MAPVTAQVMMTLFIEWTAEFECQAMVGTSHRVGHHVNPERQTHGLQQCAGLVDRLAQARTNQMIPLRTKTSNCASLKPSSSRKAATLCSVVAALCDTDTP